MLVDEADEALACVLVVSVLVLGAGAAWADWSVAGAAVEEVAGCVLPDPALADCVMSGVAPGVVLGLLPLGGLVVSAEVVAVGALLLAVVEVEAEASVVGAAAVLLAEPPPAEQVSAIFETSLTTNACWLEDAGALELEAALESVLPVAAEALCIWPLTSISLPTLSFRS